MIAVVDYGVGNLFSIQCSLAYIGADCAVTSERAVIEAADKIILPGVGAFGDAAAKLTETGLGGVVLSQARAGKPLLGVCLGMQLLYERSFEYGKHHGLGLVQGDIRLLDRKTLGENLKVPHMGWNSLDIQKNDCLLLRDVSAGAFVYYVHSYYASVSEDTVASSRYGAAVVTGIVQRGNIYGTQFHPEKSGAIGLAILKSFAAFA